MSALTDRIAAVIREHAPGHCWLNCTENDDEWATHLARQIETELELTEDQYTTQEIGVSPITLHHWQRWVSPWTEKS